MSYLTKYEKETIILWNQTDDPISIQTYDAGLKRKLAAFAKQYPELCRMERSDDLGGVLYQLEKSRLSVRLTAPYSEERRKKASEQAKKTGLNAKQA
ncbi:MAG: molecular chaperone [Eubacteriales bacterium]|nr:molecular chaperone [Eubacteriales bacterium]